MSKKTDWQDIGAEEELKKKELQEIEIGKARIALSYKDGKFGAISGFCNHVGGLLGRGTLEGDYVTCPWHYWKFHWQTGEGEPGFEEDRVPRFDVKVEKGRVLVDMESATKRNRKPHTPHPLARDIQREPGGVRVLGISTTAMDNKHPRFSTSDALLESALEHAKTKMKLETKLVRLRDLDFRFCEGFYSRHARACTWPCSITQMDKNDQLDQVYEGMVHWADVILVSTPIRWGGASALYYKMVERMNCIQNQITIRERVLIRNKVAGFIITGGQDNIQAVAGQMLGFFSELGFVLPPFPYIAHSLGWSAENMERNVNYVKKSRSLREASGELVERSVEVAKTLLASEKSDESMCLSGRKAQGLDENSPKV